jgi:hypothetical protein
MEDSRNNLVEMVHDHREEDGEKHGDLKNVGQ